MKITKEQINAAEQEIQTNDIGFKHVIACLHSLDARLAAIEARVVAPPVVPPKSETVQNDTSV